MTGEYPPQPGGVSEYTQLVAEGLSAGGDRVVVYAPAHRSETAMGDQSRVLVRRLPDRYGLGGLRWLDRALSDDRPDRLLLQYTPHSFGFKAMNVPLALWIGARASKIAPLSVMFHEVAFPFVRRPIRHNLIAAINRIMARAIAGAADEVLVTIPGWKSLILSICPGARPPECLPVPSSVPANADPKRVAAARKRFVSDDRIVLIGHFGTFGRLITDVLEPVLLEVHSQVPEARFLLMGRGSVLYQSRLATSHPDLAASIFATGDLSASEVSVHLRACDLVVQPYPDGVSARRTSVMAGLCNEVPIVTNLGPLSEPMWAIEGALALASSYDPELFASACKRILALPPSARAALGAKGGELYRREFSLERTLKRLRQTEARRAASPQLETSGDHRL